MKPLLLCAALLSPAIAFAQSPLPSTPDASALNAQTPPGAMTAQPADVKTAPQPTFMVAKWKAKFYGFAELDTMLDNTQSFAEIQGNGIVAKPGVMAGDNGRLQASIRNTRLGFSLESPEFNGVRGSATIEGDFLGFNPNPAYPNTAMQPSESGFFTSPTFRIRHLFVKVETPIVDILGGQSWTLFGFGATFNPATVALQGIVGEVYQRTPQIRLGKAVELGGGSKVELQVAALRPYQRDQQMPDLAAGLRFELGGWSGYKSTGGTGSGNANLQLAVSGQLKQFRAQTGNPASDTDFQTTSGGAVAVDALIPIIPAPSKTSHAGALTFVGEATKGTGYSDAFTGLSAGVAVGAPQDVPAGKTYAGTTLDNGSVGWDQTVGAPVLSTVDYQSLMLNLQYYLPVADGSVWLSGVFSYLGSSNSNKFAPQTAAGANATLSNAKYGSLGLFVDVTPATRVGLEGVWTRDQMHDGQVRVARRGLLSMWFIF